MESEPEIVAKKPARMTSMRQWFSLRRAQERTKTGAPEELLPKHGSTLPSHVNGGATAPSSSKPVSSKDATASAETGKDDHKDSMNDSDERGSTTAARLDDVGAEGESEEDKPKDDKDDNDAFDKEADAPRPSRDFWKEAWDSDEVGATRRALLDSKSGAGNSKDQKPSRANAIKLVGLVIEDTESKMVAYKARWGSDNNETSFGKARNILFSALVVKDMLDNVVKFDPTGYCSAAWAVASLGLTVRSSIIRADVAAVHADDTLPAVGPT